MSASLVGSEMCIRDRSIASEPARVREAGSRRTAPPALNVFVPLIHWKRGCLLYTSDAADDM
eukprot:12779897-Alexandrium_andersonii.AAC.1